MNASGLRGTTHEGVELPCPICAKSFHEKAVSPAVGSEATVCLRARPSVLPILNFGRDEEPFADGPEADPKFAANCRRERDRQHRSRADQKHLFQNRRPAAKRPGPTSSQ
jgi:hypothetical protein